MKFGLAFEIDEEKLEDNEDLEYVERLLFQAGFRKKVNDGLHVTGEDDSIKKLMRGIDALQEHAPWFCEKTRTIHVFEVGSLSNVKDVVSSPNDEGFKDMLWRN